MIPLRLCNLTGKKEEQSEVVGGENGRDLNRDM